MKILAVFLKDLRLIVRDRSAFAFLLAVPIVVILVVAETQSGGDAKSIIFPDRGSDRCDERGKIGNWIEEHVDSISDTVANIQRLHKRNLDIRSRTDSIEAESLTRVGIALSDAQPDVEQIGHTDGRVDHQAHHLAAGAPKPALKHVVHEPVRHPKIVKCVGETISYELRNDALPYFRCFTA